MLSLVQRALRNLLVGDDEVVPACGCSRADGVAEPTSPLAPLFGGPSQRSEFNDPGGRPPLPPGADVDAADTGAGDAETHAALRTARCATP